VALVVAMVVGAGCGGGQNDSSSSDAGPSGGGRALPGPTGGADGDAPSEVAPREADNATSFAVQTAVVGPAQSGRDVVSTATATLHADDIVQAKARAAAIVEAAGGVVFAEQGQFGDDPSVTMTLKVPPDRFRATLQDLADVGIVDQLDIATEDVTEQVIDLDSRIASAETSVARVRGFLDRATNVVEISSLEAELLRRETDLERLRGQKRSLDERIDFATIVLTVRPASVVVVAEPSDSPGFLDGLAAGWRALVAVGTVLLVVLGGLLPFVPVIAIAVAVVWWTRRRARAPVSVG
jgi:hypothetical protein